MNSGRELLAFRDSAGWLKGLAVSPTGTQVASYDKYGITFWNAVTGQPADRWAPPGGPISSLAYSPDGQALAYTSGKQVTVVDAQTHRPIHGYQESDSELNSVTFSADGKLIAAIARDHVGVWNLKFGEKLFTSKASGRQHPQMFSPQVALSSDGKLAALSEHGITLRDAVTGQEILSVLGQCLSFSPDGTRLASGTNSDVKVWDTTTGAELLTLRGHTDAVHSVAFSPDGKHLASCSSDRTVKLWNATPVPLQQVQGRQAHEWVHARFRFKGEREAQEDVKNAAFLPEPIQAFALQLARKQTENFGRIPLYCCGIGNKLWPKGWLQLARRGFSFAERGFRQSVSLTPNKASAHGDFAWFLVTCPEPQFRDASEALTHARKAVALDPANTDFASLLGMAHCRAAEWAAAVETLEKAIARAPAQFSGHAQLFLAMAQQQMGHPTEARQWYEQALKEISEDRSREELRSLRAEVAALLGISD